MRVKAKGLSKKLFKELAKFKPSKKIAASYGTTMVDSKFYSEVKPSELVEPVTGEYLSTNLPDPPDPEYWKVDEHGFWQFQFKEGVSYCPSCWSEDIPILPYEVTTTDNGEMFISTKKFDVIPALEVPEGITDENGALIRWKSKTSWSTGVVYAPYISVTDGVYLNDVFFRSKKMQAKMMVRRLRRKYWKEKIQKIRKNFHNGRSQHGAQY